jgi:hypothetical protein
VRLLARGPRTVLLERLGGDPGSAFPWDRDLVLHADVRSFSIADVLHLLHSSNKSGFLAFEQGDHAKAVYLHRGEVVFAASNQVFDRLGNCLLRAGTLSRDQFDEATRAYKPPAPFGKILVERGFLTPRELWNGVKHQVEEIVRSLFAYGAGTVHFWEGEIRPDNVVRLSLPTRRLIADGLRRRDELLRFLAWLEDPRVRLERVPGARAELSGSERGLYEALAHERAFPALCRRAGVEPLSGARTLQQLRLRGAVKAVQLADAEAAGGAEAPQGDDDAVRRCVQGHVELLAEYAAPIVAVEGGEGIRGRLQRVAEEAARRYPELLCDLAIGPNAVVDPEQMTARALRFPGDREREVRLALGELVSYLEFELLNHPKLEDPEDFLDGMDPLRAAL